MQTKATEQKPITLFDDQSFVLKQFDKPGEVALYYGFAPIESPTLNKTDRTNAKSISEVNITNLRGRPGKASKKEYEAGLRPEELCALFRMYATTSLKTLPHPLGVYYTLPLSGDGKTQPREQQHRLDIIDSRHPISDATVIKTALEILREEGHTDTYILINSVGDDQSKTRYRRELINFFNANKNNLPAKAQSLIKDNVFALMHYDDADVKALIENAPNPMDFLDEVSRSRFMDVLEYLETLDIPYQINPLLVGDVYFEHTVFEIRSTPPHADEQGELLARGGCYAGVSKIAGAKKDLPCVGITLSYKRATKAKKVTYTLTRVHKPQCYFMQLGPMAKLQSLHVIENLRQVRIPVHHAICKEKCHGQMALAKHVDLPFLIIMGQKEALEGNVVIRDVATYSQEVVPITELARRMKKLIKKA